MTILLKNLIDTADLEFYVIYDLSDQDDKDHLTLEEAESHFWEIQTRYKHYLVVVFPNGDEYDAERLLEEYLAEQDRAHYERLAA